jgi:hypothetical protein
MYLSELFDAILVRSGQFILASDDIELDSGKFLRLVRVALGKYNGYRPYDETFHLKMSANRRYKFNDNFTPLNGGLMLGIPAGISSVTPTAVAGSPAFNLQFVNGYGSSGYGMRNVPNQYSPVDPNFGLPGQSQVGSEQMQKSQFPWVYQHDTLYIPYSADVEVLAFWNHPIIEEEASSNDPARINLPTIGYNDEYFLDLLQGMFLKALGVSRRSFTLNDLPLTMDGADIASEGQSLEEQAMDEIRNNHSKFYLAYGD